MRKAIGRLYSLWLWIVALLLSACRLTTVLPPTVHIERTFSGPLPYQPLYVQMSGANRLLVLDAQHHQTMGTLYHSKFQAASSIEVDSEGNLFVAIDADAEHNYREIWKIDPATGKVIARVNLPGWAPTQLAMSPKDILVVGHSLESPKGSFNLDFLSAKEARLLKTLEVPGYTTDVVFDEDLAYIALADPSPPYQSGILVYNTRSLRKEAFFTVPQMANVPPFSPTWIAIDSNANRLYVLLFQYQDETPCQQHGYLATIDLHTGEPHLIMELTDVGPVQSLSDGTLLIGESCPWGQGRLLHVDAYQRRILDQTVVGPGISTLHPLGQDEFVVAVEQDPNFVHRDEAPLVFFDGRQWTPIAQTTVPYAFGIHDIAGR